MRRICRVDNNQKDIVTQLRNLGCTVLIVSQLKNCFDILVGYKGYNFAFEIKDNKKPFSQTQLTKGEEKFHDTWEGQVDIIRTFEDAYLHMQKSGAI